MIAELRIAIDGCERKIAGRDTGRAIAAPQRDTTRSAQAADQHTSAIGSVGAWRGENGGSRRYAIPACGNKDGSGSTVLDVRIDREIVARQEGQGIGAGISDRGI